MSERITTTTLFHNGQIFLSGVDPGTNAGLHRPPTFADSLLIRGSDIIHVGSSSDSAVTAARAAGQLVEHDLAGKTILPGFIDGHMHLMLLGQALNKLDLGRCRSLEDIRAAVASYAKENPDTPRILCRGWMHSMTPAGAHARDLDGLDGERDRPVLVDSKDLHSTWCNTAGLKDLGADKWADVPGGTIERDDDGSLRGVFSEAANITYVWPYLARVATEEERKAAIRSAVVAYHEVGYTGLVDMAMDDGAWEALMSLIKEDGGLPMRIAAYWLVRPSETEEENLAQVARAVEMAGRYDEKFSPDARIVGIKVICDGIVDACTAGLSEPYEHNGHREVPLWTAEQLIPVVKAADGAGLQVALHAIGDATVSTVLDVLGEYADARRRPRVEHLELTSERDVARLGSKRITASIQPVHADPAILRAWPKLLGGHRCKRAFAYREFSDAGAPLALGSDAPTAPHAPLANCYVATTRKSYREPEMEDQPVNVNFALGACEVVAAGTEGAAWSVKDEGRIGSLKAGLRADFVVVDMEWENEKLKEAKVLETWFDGKMVFRKAQ